MRTIHDYLDAAREKNHLRSDTKLAHLLGITISSVSAFRVKKALPSPETMVKLARLAGLDEQVALVELSFMSAPEGSEAKSTYEKILKRIVSLFPATLFGLFCMAPNDAFASVSNALTQVSALPESVSQVVTIIYLTKKAW